MYRLLTLLLLLVPATLFAQQPDTLRRGLLVGYGSNLSFGSFNGASASLKMEKSATHALRIGVGVALDGFNSTRNDATDRTTTRPLVELELEDTSTDVRDRNSDAHTVQVDVVVEVERYSVVAGRMRPYVLYGAFAGPRFGTSAVDDEQRHEDVRDHPSQPPSTTSNTNVVSDEIQTYAWGGGFTGGLGVEWRVAGDLSLLAEYRTRLFYERRIEKREITQVTTNTSSSDPEPVTGISTTRTRQASHQYGLRSDGLRVGAVLYF